MFAVMKPPRRALVILPALFLLLSAHQAAAALFTLAEGANIDIRTFAFPPNAPQAGDRDLQGDFQNHLMLALHRAGFHIGPPNSPPVRQQKERDAAVPSEKTGGAAGTEKPVDSVPLTEVHLTETPGPGNGTDNTAGDATDVPEGTAVLAPPAADTPATSPEPAKTPLAETPASPHPLGNAYILTGQVTLLREDVGNPRRIGGGIRIRTESSLHCAFKIIEAATGNVLISNVTSASAARIASDTEDIDASLTALTGRVMASCAAKIATRLSGSTVTEEQDPDDRKVYQDSPGKRLRPASPR